MLMFIIAGSMITPATWSSSAAASASASLNGTTRVFSAVPGAKPRPYGTGFGRERSPIVSGDGFTETITASWWPW
jgi:hypothetical protein